MNRMLFRCAALMLAIAMLMSVMGIAEDIPVNEMMAVDPEAGQLELELPEEAGEAPADPSEADGISLEALSKGEGAEGESEGQDVQTVLLGESADGEMSAQAPEPDGTGIPAKLKLGVGETYQLKAQGAKKATYASSNKSVASVSAKGVVKAGKKGNAKITVYSDGKKFAVCQVSVLDAPKQVSMSKDAMTLCVNQTGQLKAKLPKNTASQIEWKSSKNSVATVDANGVVTGVAKGKAKITATTFNGKKAACVVTVNTDPTEVSFAEASMDVGVGETVKLNPIVNEGAEAKFTWTSKDEGIAKVDGKGRVTGVKAGSTTITVKTQNNLKATMAIKVRKAPGSVALSQTEATLKKGETLQLEARLPKKTASQIKWKSSKSSVATVGANGVVTGVGKGKAKITVTTFNGKKATCVVTVSEYANGFVIEKGVVTGYVGEGGDIEIPEKDEDGNAVTAIGKAAFKGNDTITSVTIPAGVTEVGASAFEDCGRLQSVMIPNGVASIGKAAFKNCRKLSTMQTYG